MDDLPVTDVTTDQASPHVSPAHSDDEAEEITVPQSSAGETSDDDSRDNFAKRQKMSSTPDPGRLDKVWQCQYSLICYVLGIIALCFR